MSTPEVRHIPVLGREAVAALNPHAGGVYVDATFGAGGYSRMILETPGTRVIGIDRDRTAVAGGFDLVERSDGRLTLVEDRFSHLADVCAAQGDALVDGVVHNRCCYRTEPLSSEWRACGEAPAASDDLRDWLAEGGAGLVDALRRTKGGNALTIVRQNERATFRIGRKLEEQLRDRFPDHKIYDEGVAVHSLACGG